MPVAVSIVRLRDLARAEKGPSTRLFCACFDPSTGLQSFHYTTWFSLSPRRPWDVRQGRVDLELHSVSCASSRTFPRRWALLSRRGGFGKMITMRNFNSSTRTSKFCILEEPLYRHRPALGASASYHFAFACWTGGWCTFARCPLTRPLQPRGIQSETLNDLVRSSARRDPFTQKTSIHVFGHVLLCEGFRNARKVKAND